jgi:GT2 family glycosyltransferase
MKVLIGIVSKNRAGILPQAIQSALDQDYAHKEISVFDDASTDNTRVLAERYPQVNWHFSIEPKGYLYARNKFMQETDATFFCSLDDDSWFIEKDSLSKAVDYMQQHTNTGAVAFDILSPDKPDGKPLSTPYNTNTFIGCGHLLRLSAVRELGFYTPNPGFYGGEEKDMAVRLQDSGYEVVFMPGVHVWHDKTLVARDLPKQHRSGVCNDLVFAVRRIPFPLMMVAVPGKIFNHLRFSVSNNLLKPCLLGIADFLKVFPKTISTRKPVKKAAYLRFQKLSK